jgi:hypothetical protein
LGIRYLGPIDGHDIFAPEKALRTAKGVGGPVIVHTVTRKGMLDQLIAKLQHQLARNVGAWHRRHRPTDGLQQVNEGFRAERRVLYRRPAKFIKCESRCHHVASQAENPKARCCKLNPSPQRDDVWEI